MTAIQNRYDFVYLFDVTNGNPNGDPDAGNLPRLDPETNQGLVTDVCLKRKIRNYVQIAKGGEPGYDIYVQERAILNHEHKGAYEAQGIDLREEGGQQEAPKDRGQGARADRLDVRELLRHPRLRRGDVAPGSMRPGARPVQLAFARRIEPIVPLEISITRMAVTNEPDRRKERTMGRKHIVPYGLYRAHGFVSAKLAEKTGFSDDDLELSGRRCRHVRARPLGRARRDGARDLIIFRHESALGNAPAHRLFERVEVQRVVDGVPFSLEAARRNNAPPAGDSRTTA